MMRQTTWSFILAAAAAPAILIGACSDDDTVVSQPSSDAGPDGTVDSGGAGSDSGAGDSGAADGAVNSLVARGEYLVNNVASCGDCHTPHLADGSPDTSRALSGVDCFVGQDNGGDAAAGIGCLSSRNLTNDPTGLKNRTDQEIKNMITRGIRPDGKPLSGVMTYSMYANLKDEDVTAMVAYLRTVPAVSHEVKAAQPPFDNPPLAALVDLTKVFSPDPNGNPNYDSQMRGRYLAGAAAGCIDCHTPQTPAGEIDQQKFFIGNRPFPMPPPLPPTVYSANLTSDATGLAEYTVQGIVDVIRQGRDRTGKGVCPPMPVGPHGAFGGMTVDDATDIAQYVKVLPPVANQPTEDCSLP